MEYFAVIDTETTWTNRVMSIGVVIADSKEMKPRSAKCYIVDPVYKEGGMYSAKLLEHGRKNTYLGTRQQCMSDIEKMLQQYGVKKILAYNANFDKTHLDELCRYTWCDIMKIAAYRQFNKKIPSDVECFSTGKMKRGYSVEGILRMIGPDRYYCETHNAYLDAMDELSIVRLLNLEFEIYDNAIL